MFFTIAPYFLYLLAFLLLSYALGRSLINLTTLNAHHRPYFLIFCSLVLGFMLISAGVAAYSTGFKTVLLAYFLWIGAFLYWFKQPDLKRSTVFKNFFPKELMVVLVGSGLLFLAAYLAYSGNSPLGFIFPWRDTIFYAVVSNQIYQTGVESFFISGSIANPAGAKPLPYHYFELWLNAGISELFGGLYMLNFILVMAVALRVAIFAGILALWDTILGKVSKAGILVCFLLLHLKGIFLPAYAGWYQKIDVLNQLSVSVEGIKFLPGYLFFLGFALCLLRKEILLGFLFILAYPVAHIVAAPGILAAVGSIIILYFLYFRRHFTLDKTLQNRVLLSVTGLIIFMVLFYTLFGAKAEGNNSQNLFVVLKTFSFNQLAGSWKHFRYYCIKFLVVSWPYLLILIPALLFAGKKRAASPFRTSLHFTWLFAGIALLAGAVLGGLMYLHIEGHQPLQILVGVLNISLCLLVIYTIESWTHVENRRARYGIYAGIALLLFLAQNPVRIFYPTGQAQAQNMPYDNYSDAYLTQVKRLLESNPQLNRVGSCILGPKDLDYFYAYSPGYYTLGLYLPYMSNNTSVFSLSEFNTVFPTDPKHRKRAQDLTASGVFYKFVEQQKKDDAFVSVAQSQLDFIDKYKIGYVILSPYAPKNALLEQRFKQVITDPNTGERFALLQ